MSQNLGPKPSFLNIFPKFLQKWTQRTLFTLFWCNANLCCRSAVILGNFLVFKRTPLSTVPRPAFACLITSSVCKFGLCLMDMYFQILVSKMCGLFWTIPNLGYLPDRYIILLSYFAASLCLLGCQYTSYVCFLSESQLMFYVGQMCVHILAYQNIIIAVLSKSE